MSEYNSANYRKQGGGQVFNGSVEIGNGASFTGWAPVRRLLWTGVEATAAAAAAILAATEQALAAAYHTPAAQPPCARNVTITGGYSGQNGTVVVEGTDIDGNMISESLTINGASSVVGSKAFKAVTQIALPGRTHTIAKQTETFAITAGVSGDPVSLAFTVEDTEWTGAGIKSISVPVTAAMDTVGEVAAEIVRLVNLDATVAAKYTASNEAGVITLTRKDYAANDTALALNVTGESTSGVTHGSSTNGTAGVPYDTVSVGFGDKLGLPMKIGTGVCHLATYLGGTPEGTAPTFATSASALESNTIDLNSALDGNIMETLFVQR